MLESYISQTLWALFSSHLSEVEPAAVHKCVELSNPFFKSIRKPDKGTAQRSEGCRGNQPLAAHTVKDLPANAGDPG